jgi:predicted ATPase
MQRIEREGTFQRRVFFVRNLGFVTPTEARRISFEETVRFEAIHIDVYRRLGYDLVDVPAATLDERLRLVVSAVANR